MIIIKSLDFSQQGVYILTENFLLQNGGRLAAILHRYYILGHHFPRNYRLPARIQSHLPELTT